MYNKDNRINWEEIISLYNTIKWLYALGEETDDELNTNLQPLNEFRASLDHIMRIIAIENLIEYEGKDAYDESKKLKSHLRRALFDICDMIAINYRTKIVNILDKYKTEEIQGAIPNYYSNIRPRIEEISEEIACLRTNKRFNGNESEETAAEEYPKVIEELKGFYKTICRAESSLLEMQQKNKKSERNNFVVQWIIPIAAIVIGTVIAIMGWFVQN